MGDRFVAAEDRSVYDQIRELLIAYAFLPGDRLHVPDLADQLHVSATPVREALNRFCAEGLLTTVPHRGFFVKRLQQSEISNLLEMKHMILSYAANGAVGTLELDKTEARILADLAALRGSESNSKQWMRVFRRYATPMIMLIGSLAGNQVLLKSLRNVLDRLHFVRQTEILMDDRSNEIRAETAAIAQGLLEGNESAVIRTLNRQIGRERRMLSELMKECVNRLYLRSLPAEDTDRNGHRLAILAETASAELSIGTPAE